MYGFQVGGMHPTGMLSCAFVSPHNIASHPCGHPDQYFCHAISWQIIIVENSITYVLLY